MIRETRPIPQEISPQPALRDGRLVGGIAMLKTVETTTESLPTASSAYEKALDAVQLNGVQEDVGQLWRYGFQTAVNQYGADEVFAVARGLQGSVDQEEQRRFALTPFTAIYEKLEPDPEKRKELYDAMRSEAEAKAIVQRGHAASPEAEYESGNPQRTVVFKVNAIEAGELGVGTDLHHLFEGQTLAEMQSGNPDLFAEVAQTGNLFLLADGLRGRAEETAALALSQKATIEAQVAAEVRVQEEQFAGITNATIRPLETQLSHWQHKLKETGHGDAEVEDFKLRLSGVQRRIQYAQDHGAALLSNEVQKIESGYGIPELQKMADILTKNGLDESDTVVAREAA